MRCARWNAMRFSHVLVSVLTSSVQRVNSFAVLGKGNSPVRTSPRRCSSSQKEFETSHRHIQVGNLDWTLSVADISQQLLGALSGADVSIEDIKVKTINPKRARDRDKCHGGSAVVAFSSTEQASDGWKALQAYSNTNKSQYRLKYAVLQHIPPAEQPLTPEQLLVRQERAAQYARRRVRIAERTDQILAKLAKGKPQLFQTVPVFAAEALDWSHCPEEIDPSGGGGLVEQSDRAQRKRAAVEAFRVAVEQLLIEPDSVQAEPISRPVIADLGCGTGNLALPLQWCLMMDNQSGQQHQAIEMIAVDYNEQSLDRLEERAKKANVEVKTMAQNIEHLMTPLARNQDDNDNVHVDLLEPCSVVVSLHACGAASDMAMAAAVSRGVPFAISPCCIGKVSQWYDYESFPQVGRKGVAPLSDLSYPRSQWLQESVTMEEYKLLAKAADYGVIYNKDADKAELQRRSRCRLAKRAVELDRMEWAQDHGYQVSMVELPRIGPFYPKRELLLGALKGTGAAKRIEKLSLLL